MAAQNVVPQTDFGRKVYDRQWVLETWGQFREGMIVCECLSYVAATGMFSDWLEARFHLIDFEVHDSVSRKRRGYIISMTVILRVVIVWSISRRVLFHHRCLQNDNYKNVTVYYSKMVSSDRRRMCVIEASFSNSGLYF